MPGVRGLATRAFARRDVERLRRVSDGSFVRPSANPGVRVEPAFVTEEEAEVLVAEARGAASAYGYDYDGDKRAHVLNPEDGRIEATADLVNNTRVTGRPEKPGQRLPPWGYGDGFDEAKLPPGIRALVAKIRDSGHFDVGGLRDITMNLRSNSFFQLDPHVDPRKRKRHTSTSDHSQPGARVPRRTFDQRHLSSAAPGRRRRAARVCAGVALVGGDHLLALRRAAERERRGPTAARPYPGARREDKESESPSTNNSTSTVISVQPT